MKVEILEADIHYIHGVLNLVAPRGFGLMLDPAVAATDGPSNLVPAHGVAGYILERDMVDTSTPEGQTALLIRSELGDGSFVSPYRKGSTVSARRVTRMEAEGADVILTSGTGAVSVDTPANTELGYAAGKLRVRQGGDELAFILRAQLAPKDPETNDFRLLLERP
jgi:hypothetical protein